MIASFREFIDNLIVENLHPELQSVVTSGAGYNSKQSQISKKVKQLTSRGEHTGIEGNMPKGSARAYLQHSEDHPIVLDGQQRHIPVGTKVAIRASLDKHHDHAAHYGLSLGQLQNQAEGGDHWVNNNYRILTHDPDHPGTFHSNKEYGIFPPLIDHDHENHHWSHVGHARDIKPGEFRTLTKTKEHPKGISHHDFVNALSRTHNRNTGAHWSTTPKEEAHLDHVDTHPLVQKFADYHNNTGNSPDDYRQKKNLGIFEHPDGSKHIVARDHGFNLETQKAYRDAMRKERDTKQYERPRR